MSAGRDGNWRDEWPFFLASGDDTSLVEQPSSTLDDAAQLASGIHAVRERAQLLLEGFDVEDGGDVFAALQVAQHFTDVAARHLDGALHRIHRLRRINADAR